MRIRRRTTTPLAAAIATVLLSGSLALATRAEPAATGRDVVLGLEAACAQKAESFYALAADRKRVIGQWVTIAGPTFGRQPSEPRPGLTAHAVDPLNPHRLLVSDGESIQLSEDGGCTWRGTYTAPLDPASPTVTDAIRQIEFSGRGEVRRAYAVMSRGRELPGPITVLVSDNGGVDWETRSAGLPPIYGRADSYFFACQTLSCPTALLAAAPNDPDVAYLSLSEVAGPTLFRTANGGRSWEPLPSLEFIDTAVTEMAVAPDNADDLWVVFTDDLARSRDGGRTWEWPSGLEGVAGLHLSSDESRASVQVLSRTDPIDYAAPYDRITRSVDGGVSWQTIDLAQRLHGTLGVAPGGAADDVVLATDGPDGVLQFDPAARRFLDIAAPGLGDVAAPRRDSTSEPVYWFRQFAGLAVFVPGPPPGPVPREKLPFEPFDPPPVEQTRVPGTLVPAQLELELGREGTRVINYRVDLPALPTPVDIWFLIDTSGSMEGAIEGVRQGFETIIEELSASGFDAWFGLATFPARRQIYDRQADVAPPNEELYAALDRLAADGGVPEIHPTALYQSVTGAGQPDAGIPPGRGATFRPQALKIIVHATDEAYGTEGTGPTREEAARALATRAVRHVGLDLAAGEYDTGVPPDEEGLRSTKRDHDFMARETGTLAPAGGIDCNGDGTNELEEGDPITCPIVRGRDNVEITPAIVSAVRGVRDETAVALTVVDPGGMNVEIGEPTRSPVDVKVPNSLPFAVRYSCPPEMTGKVGEVRLRATVRGVPAAEGTARLGCGVAAPAAATPGPRPPTGPVPVILAPPQALPTLEPPGLAPLNQTAPAQAGQPSAQPGLAAQPSEVATARQRAGRDGPAPPSPSGGPEDRQSNSAATTGGTLGAGAALAVALGGWAVRRERQRARTGIRA